MSLDRRTRVGPPCMEYTRSRSSGHIKSVKAIRQVISQWPPAPAIQSPPARSTSDRSGGLQAEAEAGPAIQPACECDGEQCRTSNGRQSRELKGRTDGHRMCLALHYAGQIKNLPHPTHNTDKEMADEVDGFIIYQWSSQRCMIINWSGRSRSDQ